MNDTHQHQPLIGRGKSLLEQVLRFAQTRLELLSTEIQLEKVALMGQLKLAAIAALCAWLAGLTLVVLVALALPPDIRLIALSILFVALIAVSIVSWILLRRRARRGPLFARVIHQLHLDRASLSQEP